MARDPVCGKDVDELRARAVAIYGRSAIYFCSPEHKADFSRDPEAFLARAAEPAAPQPSAPSPATGKSGRARKATPTPTAVTPVAEPAEGVARGEPTPPAGQRLIAGREESGPIEPPRSRIGVFVLVVLALLAVAAAVASMARG